jgi:hypothetical protein
VPIPRARAQLLSPRKRWHIMTTVPGLQPPAILHDCATDQIVTWTGDQADDFRHSSRARDDGTIAWREYVFDGWGNVLGG